MRLPSISIIVPAYNEEATIKTMLTRLQALNLQSVSDVEVIVINDGSSDKTREAILTFQRDHPDFKLKYLENNINQGKGAALHAGFKIAVHQYTLVQDADLEYDPQEIDLLMIPVIKDNADIVYGSRFIGSQPHRILFFWHSIGNKLLTFCCNIVTNLNLTDMETCYKLVRTDLIKKIKLKEKRFGFEPEVTIKLARIPNIKFYEVGISYYGRTYEEGKKINWKDGFRAIYCIIKYGVFRL